MFQTLKQSTQEFKEAYGFLIEGYGCWLLQVPRQEQAGMETLERIRAAKRGYGPPTACAYTTASSVCKKGFLVP